MANLLQPQAQLDASGIIARMKISLGMNLRGGAWGGGNQFGNALTTYLRERGCLVVHDLAHPDIDLILLADPRIDLEITAYNHHDILRYLRQVNPNALVVHRINECDERKNEVNQVNPKLRQATHIADHTVFVSGWLRDLHLGQGMEPHAHSVILNGSDPSIFHPHGYQRWDGREPLRIVTHHWGRDWLKGFDIYQRLDELQASHPDQFAFTYIGNLPDGFRFQHARYLEPLSGVVLANELRSQHVYITASRNEPGSNHQNEGALCGLPLLYIDSGSIPEYAKGFGISFTPETFETALDDMRANYDHWADCMAAYPHTAERTSQQYFELFTELLNQRDTVIKRRRWLERIPKIDGNREQAVSWLRSLPQAILPFLEILRIGEGRYLPATEGLTRAGQEIALPFSCLALKTAYMVGGLPHPLTPSPSGEGEFKNLLTPLSFGEGRGVRLQNWISFIQSFQAEGNPLHTHWGRDAFIDMPLAQRVIWQTRRWQRLRERIFPPRGMTNLQRMLSAESKQAIASLAEVGAQTRRPYRDFPTTPRHLKRYLESFDWSKPWASGAHLATIAVFYRTEAPRFLPEKRIQDLIAICNEFVVGLVDGQTGAYFRGERPAYGELTNGAMKILTALDWLETPIHEPEKLIDTTLSDTPLSEGCHLVDAVYVLYRCSRQTNYRRAEIERYCVRLVDMMVAHYNPLDGGFSYNLGSSQTHMHRVHITRGRPVSDIHGTILLTWATAMILDLLGHSDGWHIIKP